MFDFRLQRIRVMFPVGHMLAAPKSMLGGLDGPFRRSRMTNMNHPLETLERVAVGTDQILEELDAVRGHRALHEKAIANGPLPERL